MFNFFYHFACEITNVFINWFSKHLLSARNCALNLTKTIKIKLYHQR